METKKKILFVLPDLTAGGAQRIMSFVSQHLNNKTFDVKLIVIGFKKDAVYKVDAVEVQYLNKTRLLASVTMLFHLIVKEKPTIVISSIGHVNILMGFFSILFRKIKFIGREASVVSERIKFIERGSKVYFILLKLFYPRLSAIICQSNDMKEDFINVFGFKSSKLILIYNPITNFETIIKNSNSKDKIHFVTVGRLSVEKGYLRIIEGLSKISNYNFHYTIIGSGPQATIIKENIDKYKLTDKVSFIPHTSKVLEEIGSRDFFIQGSYVEGFGNALLESCTVGTPVIAFKAPGGTKDIVVNGINGFLVEDETEFVSVLNDIDTLKTLDRDEVICSVVNKFNASKIIKQYEELFNTI
ncbi:glycosyltransferase [Flavobacterium sp. ZB4P13]|uniref:glycosyltransferase n=1 Tax=Flavobacterium sp. ZB4P13 TaxID=3401728 RepID=UPI003AACD70E